MSSISVRIPDNLKKALESVARETERSTSFHVQKAIELYLKEQVDLQISLDRLNNTSDEIVSSSEIRGNLSYKLSFLSSVYIDAYK